MILAILETPNFTFTAVGQDACDADALLLLAWRKHCEEFVGADPELARDAVTDGDVDHIEINLGVVLRDDTLLIQPA